MKTFKANLGTKKYPAEQFIDLINGDTADDHDCVPGYDVAKLRARISLENIDKPVIMVGMGTCGLANGAQGMFTTNSKNF
ncbi:MAG: hypothetical protein U5N56_12570 [Candidatus Marinimicrobia bacterium]|nr:hypothetical protein [Candidatus Neomarinimicrobiota bacterium]